MCGCTQNRACLTPAGPCYWAKPGLCSACVGNAMLIVGFGMALTAMNKGHDQPTMCKDAAIGNGLYLDDFKRAGCEPYDMRELRKIFRSDSR